MVGIDVDGQAHAPVHGHGEGLGASHPAEPGREREGALECSPEALVGDRREGLVRALEDALGADVDP